MNQSIEKTTLTNLISNEDYARKVIPFLKSDYFKVKEERIVFEEIQKFIDKYKKIPTKTTLNIEIENRKHLNQTIISKKHLKVSFHVIIQKKGPKSSQILNIVQF